MSSLEVEEFLKGPLVAWFISCVKDSNLLASYSDLVDGTLLHDVFTQICPTPYHIEIKPANEEWPLRIKNLERVLENLKQFYEENLGQLLVKLPNILGLGKEPELHVEDMKLLLLLILGCAVQCPEKESFILDIKTLDVSVQVEIVNLIKLVTEDQSIVINPELLVNLNSNDLFHKIKNLTDEKYQYSEKLKKIELDELDLLNNSLIISKNSYFNKSKLNSPISFDHLETEASKEVVEKWKSKVRKLYLELEEKSESLMESRGEIEHNTMLIADLYKENEELKMEARAAKSYRDELDATIERAEKADRLEMEVSRYREKLNDIEFYKTTIEELREDNKVLLETKETLEDELKSQQKMKDKVEKLETQVMEYKQLINKINSERTVDREKYQQLQEENTHLQNLVKSKKDVSISISDSEEPEIANRSLSDQLTNSAQKRERKLELENRRLSLKVRHLQESPLQESPKKLHFLEKERKHFDEKFDSLSKNYERLVQQNSVLEHSYKLARQENRQLKSSLKKQEEELEDHITLESQHHQLGKDYEDRLHERETLQNNIKELKNELKLLKDSYDRLKLENSTLRNGRESFETEIRNLKIIRREHLKLKEDFRNMFIRNELLMAQNKSLEGKNNEEVKKSKIKMNELENELGAKEERCLNLEFKINNLNQRCEDLMEMNEQLNNDRQKLMDYTHALSLQNKDFLEQTLEEKDNFYSEKRTYTNTINQLNCQIRKLEEKIMEYYKNAPASTCNKGKTSSSKPNFVQKVKKASSDLFNKNRRTSGSWDDTLKPTDKKEQSDMQNRTMTLDPRLLRGRRGPRDYFSLGNFGKRKQTSFYEDNVISRCPSVFDIKTRGSQDELQSQPELNGKCNQFNNRGFGIINETEDVNSNRDENQEHNFLENKASFPKRSASKTSLWLEYGCA